MNYESDAKTVRGLSVATIVLSILGIVLSLALTMLVGWMVNVAVDAYTSEQSSPLESIVEPDSGLMDSVDDVNQLFEVLDNADIEDFELVLANAKVKEINAFGKVVQTADPKLIKTALDAFDDKYGLDIDTKEMTEALTSIKPKATKAIGEELAEMDKDDVDGLLDILGYIDEEDIDSLPDMIDTLSETPEVKAAKSVIAAAISFFVIAMIGASVVALIAAILSLRNCRRPEKLTGAFVWSIIAAVLAFFAAHWITMILLIITCVYVSKIRKFRLQQGSSVQSDASPVSPASSPAAGPVPPQE